MNFNTPLKNNFIVKIVVIVFSIISPFLMICYGELSSLSSYWSTPLQPLFIGSNILTAMLLFNIPKWKLSAILLFLLTCFSVEYYDLLHNIFAVLFFVVNLYPMYTLKKYRIFSLIYLMCVVWSPSLLWIEVHGIIVLCFYHLFVLVSYNKIQKKRKSL